VAVAGGEAGAIARTPAGPVTGAVLLAGLKDLGVGEGDRLLVHASLSALGFVPGGAQAVVEALKAAVHPNGLLVAPAFSAHLSDPDHWQAPPVPEAWRAIIRAEAPTFDPAVTPSRGIGAVSELLRTSPGAVRGPHPLLSFTAWGRGAAEVVAPHPVTVALGDGSPLQRLYDLDAKVLFLGSGYATCTAFHLGEHRAGAIDLIANGAPMLADGERCWVAFDLPHYDTDPFETMGVHFEAVHDSRAARIGAADCRAFSLRDAADFAETWMIETAQRG
jgi:aminoglycoside 3-N-acetyltransferase